MSILEIPFSRKQNINKYLLSKKIVFFGAGNIAEKTSRIIDITKLDSILDNSKNLHGDIQLGVKVEPIEYLNRFNKEDLMIIICTTSFFEVSNQLHSLGFEPFKHFIVSPLLNDLRVIDEMESLRKELIFSSGSPANKNSLYGGGIYKLNVEGDTWNYEKMISGNCYGISNYENHFVTIDSNEGLIEFDKDFSIIRTKDLPEHSRGHGVVYSKEKQAFFITCSYLDKVLMLDNDLSIVKDFSISKKTEKHKDPIHHCNDCCVVGESIYISMFSRTGNWKKDVFDGCVLEIDIDSGEIVGELKSNLWMPHNIELINGSFYVLDSLKGSLLGNNFMELGNFPAFTRGLAHDGSYFYLGQSRNRNFSKNIGISNNISIDAGIIIFDDETKVSRFLQVSPRISEIHSIKIL